jgi:hypothetical protein
MYSTAQSYLDVPVPMPSAPPQPPYAPPSYDAATQWVVPVYSTKIDEMTYNGASAHLCNAEVSLGGNAKQFTESVRKALSLCGTNDTKRQYMCDVEKLLFEKCIARYAMCVKTTDTNAVFARGNLVEMAELCNKLKTVQ